MARALKSWRCPGNKVSIQESILEGKNSLRALGGGPQLLFIPAVEETPVDYFALPSVCLKAANIIPTRSISQLTIVRWLCVA